MIDRSQEGLPLLALPGELRDSGHRHRHGPSSRPAAGWLRQCSCGELGTYSYGTWRPATRRQLLRCRRQLAYVAADFGELTRNLPAGQPEPGLATRLRWYLYRLRQPR
jgi:hypothetical protein